MYVLVACEESQRVCTAFRAKGATAFSCDIQDESGGHPEWHIKGDVLELINGNCTFTTVSGDSYRLRGEWDLIIAHPPCTYLTVAGARYTYANGELNTDRYQKGLQAAEFFYAFYNSNCSHICVENPLPMRCFNLPKYTQIIHPCYFGSEYKKRTCLWLKGLPKLKSTVEYNFRYAIPTSQSRWYNSYKNAEDRHRSRSKTFPEIAQAMADQWYPYILNNT